MFEESEHVYKNFTDIVIIPYILALIRIGSVFTDRLDPDPDSAKYVDTDSEV
jgi:hypothetical protein